MPKISQVSGKEMGRVLTRLGFVFKSQKGSHMKFVRQSDRSKEIVVVPNHKVIRKGTLRGILKQLNLDIANFKKFL